MSEFIYVVYPRQGANPPRVKYMSKTAFCARHGIKRPYDEWLRDGGEVVDVFDNGDSRGAFNTLQWLHENKRITLEELKDLLAALNMMP